MSSWTENTNEYIRVLDLPTPGKPLSGLVVGKGQFGCFVNNITFSSNFTGWCDG